MATTEKSIFTPAGSGHVNNVQYLEFLEMARKDWYHYCLSIGVEAMVVHINADYKKEVFGNEQLRIRTVLDRIGNTSFTLHQTIYHSENEPVLNADVTLVTVDRETRTKCTVPDTFRELLHTESLPSTSSNRK